MRRVAAYAFCSSPDSAGTAEEVFTASCTTVEEWLRSKGVEREPKSGTFDLTDGRHATLQRIDVRSGEGHLIGWRLAEETHDEAVFATNLGIAIHESRIDVHCTLEAGHLRPIVAPLRVEPRCPRVLRLLAARQKAWMVGSTPLQSSPERLVGSAGGARAAALIGDLSRCLPVITTSEAFGFPLHPDLDTELFHDCFALACVLSLNEEASWELTRQLGKEWSCYNGAVRLYWPPTSGITDPFKNPLWTATNLLAAANDSTEEAMRLVVSQLRCRLSTLSTLSIQEPAVFERIRAAHRREEFARARTTLDMEELARSYAEDNVQLNQEIAELRDQLARVRTELENERTMRAFQQGIILPDAIIPETEHPPQTIAEAVQRARAELADALLLGSDVDRGVAELKAGAGPPEKILKYLRVLAEASRSRRTNTLNMPLMQWLQERGVKASSESDTIKNSKADMRKRRWDAGGEKRQFELHLKPNDGTPPDQCTRIYFEWDETRKIHVVGWIGRHP